MACCTSPKVMESSGLRFVHGHTSSCERLTWRTHFKWLERNLPFPTKDPGTQTSAKHSRWCQVRKWGLGTLRLASTLPHRQEWRTTLPRILGSWRGLHFPEHLAAIPAPPPAPPLPDCCPSERLPRPETYRSLDRRATSGRGSSRVLLPQRHDPRNPRGLSKVSGGGFGGGGGREDQGLWRMRSGTGPRSMSGAFVGASGPSAGHPSSVRLPPGAALQACP